MPDPGFRALFTARDGLYKNEADGDAGDWSTSSPWGQGVEGIENTNPGAWFAWEWAKLTGAYVTYQVTAYGGAPVTPGLAGETHYWAPQNAIGDAAGQTSLMNTFDDAFTRFAYLNANTAGINVIGNIAFVWESEDDIRAYAASDPDFSLALFESSLRDWLDALVTTCGIDYFAIVKPGRRGDDGAEVDSNASFVTAIRDVYDDVIADRSDCYDIFPDLIVRETPYVHDDLVVDQDYAWVSGQGGLTGDIVHFTAQQYKAVGITGARNLFSALGLSHIGDCMANTNKSWRGSVEPAQTGSAGNEVRLWRGAVEPDSAILLVPADAVHAHAVDNVELLLGAQLIVADAVHAHAVDNVTLRFGKPAYIVIPAVPRLKSN